ncbi:MAG: PH domain-containing protein [Muribaculaceae bacterium]|nr:PH domain-containing protein [Muribaculaceae bacterium]
MTRIYKSKIDWWISAVIVFTVSFAFIGPIIDGEIFIVGIIVAALLGILEVVMFASVKYQIRDRRLGIRTPLYRWEWFPIDKISEVKKNNSFLSASALSTKRIAIKFSDRKILKSYMPLEISPKDRDAFIAHLKEINSTIKIAE